MRATFLHLALALSLASCGGADDSCLQKSCADFGGSASVGFTKCYSGVGPLRTQLEDADGQVFFDCTDKSASDTCIEETVAAEEAYCAAHP
jgi:hypothetical protein